MTVAWDMDLRETLDWNDGTGEKEIIFELVTSQRLISVYVPDEDWQRLGRPERVRVTVEAVRDED